MPQHDAETRLRAAENKLRVAERKLARAEADLAALTERLHELEAENAVFRRGVEVNAAGGTG